MENLAETIRKFLKFRMFNDYKVMLVDTTGKILERFTLNSIPENVIKLYSKKVYSAFDIDSFGMLNIQIVNV